eukprot:scaffold26965_cov106-Isochrysis_galbana.AAC.8
MSWASTPRPAPSSSNRKGGSPTPPPGQPLACQNPAARSAIIAPKTGRSATGNVVKSSDRPWPNRMRPFE